MDPSRLTPGVERILARAKDLARESGQDQAAPRHLLYALSREESRGSEILLQHDLTSEQILQELPLHSNDDAQPADPNAEGEFHRELHEVLKQAELESARQGCYAELGSEHLLWGLAASDSRVAEFLQSHGLSRDTLKTRIDESLGHPDSPLAVDFQLSDISTSAGDETDVYRILDAAANRVREGVRVLEDALRFAWDHGRLTDLLKTWRHDLRAALSQLDDQRLLSSRDSAGDVGTELNTPAEQQRRSVGDVVRANGKRVQEGLRSLEEFGKMISPVFGSAISRLRYRFYTIEKLFAVQTQSRKRLSDRSVYLLVTRDACHHDWETTIRAALTSGVDVIQLREKALPDRQIMAMGRLMRKWTRETGALLIINDRPDLAVLLDADGVHVGQEELSVRQARRIIGPDRMIGVSAHTIDQARHAVDNGADYLGVGPVFPSQTKSFASLAGLEFVRRAAEEIPLPWFAIGGITLENVGQVQAAGAARIAVSHSVCASSEPGEIAVRFKELLSADSKK